MTESRANAHEPGGGRRPAQSDIDAVRARSCITAGSVGVIATARGAQPLLERSNPFGELRLYREQFLALGDRRAGRFVIVEPRQHGIGGEWLETAGLPECEPLRLQIGLLSFEVRDPLPLLVESQCERGELSAQPLTLGDLVRVGIDLIGEYRSSPSGG